MPSCLGLSLLHLRAGGDAGDNKGRTTSASNASSTAMNRSRTTPLRSTTLGGWYPVWWVEVLGRHVAQHGCRIGKRRHHLRHPRSAIGAIDADADQGQSRVVVLAVECIEEGHLLAPGNAPRDDGTTPQSRSASRRFLRF